MSDWLGWILLILMIIAGRIVYVKACDENIHKLRNICLGVLVIAIFIIYKKATNHSNTDDFLTKISVVCIFVLPITGYFTEKKCGFLSKGCPKCGRKDTFKTYSTGRNVLDRVYSRTNENGKAVYHEVADVYYHQICENCGYENDYVRRESYDTTY